jgi:glycosyltransferase involved in cell wall biosynthesis
MRASPHFPFTLAAGERLHRSLSHWLAGTGVDLQRVEFVPPVPTKHLAALYANSDVGLFPSRCEGGPNLVLMEYMACGGAAIATDFSGHRDVLTSLNSIRLRGCRPFLFAPDGIPTARWCEPDIDEIVESLERAYRDRSLLDRVGRQAAIDSAQWVWDRAARRFLDLLQPPLTSAGCSNDLRGPTR